MGHAARAGAKCQRWKSFSLAMIDAASAAGADISCSFVSDLRSARQSTVQDHDIDREIDQHNSAAEGDLSRAGEAFGIERAREIVLHKIAGVSRLARALPQADLERGEWADPPREFDPGGPQDGGDMQPC